MIILSFTDEIREIIRKHSLINATSHEGEANVGVVLGRVLGERAELRKKAKEIVGKPMTFKEGQFVASATTLEFFTPPQASWFRSIYKRVV